MSSRSITAPQQHKIRGDQFTSQGEGEPLEYDWGQCEWELFLVFHGEMIDTSKLELQLAFTSEWFGERTLPWGTWRWSQKSVGKVNGGVTCAASSQSVLMTLREQPSSSFLLGLANCLTIPSVLDISLQSRGALGLILHYDWCKFSLRLLLYLGEREEQSQTLAVHSTWVFFLLSGGAPCPKNLLPLRPVAGDIQAVPGLNLCWSMQIWDGTVSLFPSKALKSCKGVDLTCLSISFMVKGTGNECKYLRFPLWATETSLFSIFSDVTQVLQWWGQRSILRDSPHQEGRRALSRTLHFSVSPLLLSELLYDFDHPCPTVTAFPSAHWLSACQLSQPCMSMKSAGVSLLNTSIPLC